MIKNLTYFGKYLFAVPFLYFGVRHFMDAPRMSEAVPLPGGSFWIYFTGFAQLALVAAIVLGKWDKLAAFLCALMLLIFIVVVHVPNIIKGDPSALSGMMKDIGLMGAALMYAGFWAKDDSIVGSAEL